MRLRRSSTRLSSFIGPVGPLVAASLIGAPASGAPGTQRDIVEVQGDDYFFAAPGVIGGDGYVTLELEPGEYAVICRVTEPISGVSHVHLGMVKGFHVEQPRAHFRRSGGADMLHASQGRAAHRIGSAGQRRTTLTRRPTCGAQ